MACSKLKYFIIIFLFYLSECVTAEDYIYYSNVDKFYKFHRSQRTWFEARNVCRYEEATLAMPRNTEEMNVLKDYFNNNYPSSSLYDVHYKDYILLGFHDHFSENEYITLDGHSLQYYFHKWGKGQPDNSGNEDCGSLHRYGVINDFPCGVSAVFMCEKPGKNHRSLQLTSSFTDDPAYRCRSDLELCYKLHWNPKQWSEARLICYMEGGRLAIIRNKKVEDFLVSIFNDPDNHVPYVKYENNVLLGFHDLYQEGKFVTTEEKPLNTYGYENWSPGQPDNYQGAENCGSMLRNGLINDYPCPVPAVFMCERPKGIDARFPSF